MTVTFVHTLVVGGALFGIGFLSVASRRSLGATLRGVPIMAAGAAVALAGSSRLASSPTDPVAGQELAVLAALGALAFLTLGALARGLR
jgi:NADH:ubiquinone oxidoreductase subunit K